MNVQKHIEYFGREELEREAIETVSSELYYDLVDSIEATTDDDLLRLIGCGGDYKKEVKGFQE